MNCKKCGKVITITTIEGLCMECWPESYREKNPPTMYGWVCPRCGAVNSPFSLKCDCPPPIRTWTGASSDCIIHSFDMNGVCVICGYKCPPIQVTEGGGE